MTTENHGKVGEALYVKMTLDAFNTKAGADINVPNLTQLEPEQIAQYRVTTTVPIVIDESTKGNYEVVCEHGVEIY